MPRRFVYLIRGIFISLATFSVLVSLGAPGLGWVVAAVNLFLVSLLTPLIGRRWVGLCLGISIVHLFTFGPMSDPKSLLDAPLLFSLGFVLAPVLIALVSLRMRSRPSAPPKDGEK